MGSHLARIINLAFDITKFDAPRLCLVELHLKLPCTCDQLRWTQTTDHCSCDNSKCRDKLKSIFHYRICRAMTGTHADVSDKRLLSFFISKNYFFNIYASEENISSKRTEVTFWIHCTWVMLHFHNYSMNYSIYYFSICHCHHHSLFIIYSGFSQLRFFRFRANGLASWRLIHNWTQYYSICSVGSQCITSDRTYRKR
jgi:hypothetical protein